jgi:hypothetical protein
MWLLVSYHFGSLSSLGSAFSALSSCASLLAGGCGWWLWLVAGGWWMWLWLLVSCCFGSLSSLGSAFSALSSCASPPSPLLLSLRMIPSVLTFSLSSFVLFQVSNKETIRVASFNKVSKELERHLYKSEKGVDKQHLGLLKEFLEKTLVLDPTKRIEVGPSLRLPLMRTTKH